MLLILVRVQACIVMYCNTYTIMIRNDGGGYDRYNSTNKFVNSINFFGVVGEVMRRIHGTTKCSDVNKF